MKKGTIYKIVNKNNGFVYIGQTVQSLKRRWKSHKSHWKCHTHHNELLQRVYDKYGLEAFSIEEIEQCDIEKLDEHERYWINYYDSTNREKGYNFENGGNEYKKHSPSTIKKIIETHRGHNNKLNAKQVTKIKELIIKGVSFTEIAAQFRVTVHCIYRIKNLENWKYVSSELNEAVFSVDTSRDIKRLNSEEIKECKALLLKGKPISWVANHYGIPYRRFFDNFKDVIEKTRKNKENVCEICRNMFLSNYPKNEILEKTGLSNHQYVNIIKGLEEIRREKNIRYVGKAKSEGKTNPVIAKELNVNRCTVTVYWKEYKQKYADTVLNVQIAKG